MDISIVFQKKTIYNPKNRLSEKQNRKEQIIFSGFVRAFRNLGARKTVGLSIVKLIVYKNFLDANFPSVFV